MSEGEKEVFGRVYRITHPKHHDECYIGRTVIPLFERLDSHLSSARRMDGESDQKLHHAMRFRNCEGFEIEEIGVAYTKCDLVRLEHDTIVKHDSIENGWNKVLPNPDNCKEDEVKTGSQYTIDEEIFTANSLSELCRKTGVSNNTVNFYRNKGQSIEDAVSSAREAKNKPRRVYRIYRQRYNKIREIADSRFNRHNLKRKTIERRIKKSITNGTADVIQYGEGNEVEIRLSPEILQKLQKQGVTYSVKLPDGTTIGPHSLTELYSLVKDAHPEIPGLSTVRQRITNPNVNKAGLGWTSEQAFAFEVPPNFTEVDKLVRESGYSYVPSVVEGGSLSSFSKPLILHDTKEVFQSQSVFCEEYGIDASDFGKLLDKGMSLGDILEKYGLDP